MLNAVAAGHRRHRADRPRDERQLRDRRRPPQGIERNKPLDVTVKVKRTASRCGPKQVVAPAAGSAKPPKNAKGALGQVLRDPRLAADVGLRVTSYSAQGVEPDKVKTVIVAQVDEPPGEARDLSWGFEVHDGDRIVADAFEKAKVKDAARRADQLCQPAARRLRCCVCHHRRQGPPRSVDHPLVTDLQQLGDVKVSDVFVGEAVDGHFQPRISLAASVPQLVTFVEVYGKDASAFDNVSVEFSLRGMDGANRGACGRRPGRRQARTRRWWGHCAGPRRSGVCDVVATVLAGRQPLGAVEREIIIGQER